MHMNKSFGFAFINGEIAAMAVAPHIAVPDAIRIDNLVSILKILEIRIPIAKTKITKIEMNGKYVAVRVTTFDADNVNPKITMPIWRSFVPTVLLINPLDDSKNKVKLINNKHNSSRNHQGSSTISQNHFLIHFATKSNTKSQGHAPDPWTPEH